MNLYSKGNTLNSTVTRPDFSHGVSRVPLFLVLALQLFSSYFPISFGFDFPFFVFSLCFPFCIFLSTCLLMLFGLFHLFLTLCVPFCVFIVLFVILTCVCHFSDLFIFHLLLSFPIRVLVFPFHPHLLFVPFLCCLAKYQPSLRIDFPQQKQSAPSKKCLSFFPVFFCCSPVFFVPE